MTIRYVAVVECDHTDGGRKCERCATYADREPADGSPEAFAERAVAQFARQGWRCGPAGDRCPLHNTNKGDKANKGDKG